MNTPAQISSAEPPDPPTIPSRSTLQFSDTEPTVAVGTCQELDQALHQAELRCTSQHPIVVSLYVHGHRLGIGLGLPESFVTMERCEPTPGPAVISIGEARSNRRAVLFFLGWPRAVIPERNLLPATKARQILREFFESGARSAKIEWEAL